MSGKDNSDEIARLERLNGQLKDSLKRCQALIRDYETRLVANSNESQENCDADHQKEA